MCRSKPLVARKWKFAMKLVKNCIKQCQFWGDYQSILSDVDKHQRMWASNPNRDNTLQFDDNFDEQNFLLHCAVAQNQSISLDKSKSAAPVEERKHSSKKLLSSSRADSSNTVNVVNLSENMRDLDDEDPYHPKSTQKGYDEWKSISTTPGWATKTKDSASIDNWMILPHLHKHDLFKKDVYQKPSTWICAGYFTELGCLSTFDWMFKHIDFEFPHYECQECEFQLCCECAKYYADNLETVNFIHRTYYPKFHLHPVKLVLRSERDNWICSGVGLPNKCRSSSTGEPLIGYKQWTCQLWDVKLCYLCIKRKDIENVTNHYLVHEHQLFIGNFKNFYDENESIFCDAGERSIGISHEIDSEQKVLICAHCNFNWCQEWFDLVKESHQEEEKAEHENQMMDDSITQLGKDQVVYVKIHKHPLIRVVDRSALCNQAIGGNCLSLENKSNLSEPVYFKWLKDKCNFQIWALCTSQWVKKVKTVNGNKTWVIF
jgi:hypothetical protein